MIVDAIDREREDVAPGGLEHHQRALVVAERAGQAEDVGERNLGHAAAADGGDARAADAVERHRRAVGADDLLDRRARDREMLVADRHRQRGDDGQRQRNPQRHSSPAPDGRINLDHPADALDVGTDDVHADPATRNGGHRLRGRQSGFEDQGEPLGRGQRLGLGLGQQLAGDRFLDQPLAVDALAVVDDVDQDLVARLTRRDRQQADLALARLAPVGGGLDAMIDRVADDVGQRIADHFDHFAIELDVTALDIDHDLLAELTRKVADQARDGDEQILDPLHAGAGDRVAHLGDDPRQSLECAVDRDIAGGFAEAAGELVAGEHHVGNARHHSVEQFDRQADGARRGDAARAIGGGDRRGDDRGFGAGRERGDQRFVVAGGKIFIGVDRGDHFADPVDDMEHRADQRLVRRAAPGAAIGERVLGGVAERFQAREIEEAAIAFDRVDEAEDRIEAGAVVGTGFPGDDLAAQRIEHFPALGHEVGNKIVHRSRRPPRVPALYGAKTLTRRYP